MTTRQDATDKAIHWADQADRRINNAAEHHQNARDAAGDVAGGWRHEQQLDLAHQEIVLADRARQQALMWVQIEPLLPAVAVGLDGIATPLVREA